MFKKLRNKLILINFGITSIMIVTIFTFIYIMYTNSANRRPPIPEGAIVYTDDVESIIEIQVRSERDIAARELLMMLIVSGIAIEVIVVLVSYYLAEQAIKPVEEAYDTQKVFIANASHEIKTPLAAISANLEAADIKNNKWISNVEQETAKLATLNNELLALARADLIEENDVKKEDLIKILDKALRSFESRLGDIEFVKKIDVSNKVKINSVDFSQILGILMDNAIKYCDKKITLKVTNHELIVMNDGVSISEKNLPHIFERFYQVDKTSEGVGLGLSIAKVVAERNGWSLNVESKNKSTKFILIY